MEDFNVDIADHSNNANDISESISADQDLTASQAPLAPPVQSALVALEAQKTRLASTGELLNDFLANRMKEIESILRNVTRDFHEAITSRLDVKANDVVEFPFGGRPVVLAEWENQYANDKKLASFERYKTWKITTNKDAQHAVRAIERCKTARIKISNDLEFFREWQRDWEGEAMEIMKEVQSMFDDIIRPLEHHEMQLERNGRFLSDEITGYARRQSM